MPKITELFAFVVCDANEDDEGVMAMHDGITWVPMIGADMDRVDSLRPIADQIAMKTNKPYKILKFRLAEMIETSH